MLVDIELQKRTTAGGDFKFGRMRVSSNAADDETKRATRPPSTGFYYVFGAATLLVLAMLVWPIVDHGVDTQQRVSGQVVHCSGSIRRQFPCTVRLENGVVAPVYLVGHSKGDSVVLAKLRRPFSGDEYYAPAD